MTSIPASRSARAITFAPRSCPSRPGLATSTRIFTSAIDHYLTTEPRKLRLEGLDVQASPQIPRGNAAIGSPGFGNFFHNVRLGQFPVFVVPRERRLQLVIASAHA